MEKSASENLTQNKFVILSNGKTRESRLISENIKSMGEGHLAWQEGLSFENKQAPIRGVAMEMLLGSMKVIMNS